MTCSISGHSPQSMVLQVARHQAAASTSPTASGSGAAATSAGCGGASLLAGAMQSILLQLQDGAAADASQSQTGPDGAAPSHSAVQAAQAYAASGGAGAPSSLA